jgi:hypothetical protein
MVYQQQQQQQHQHQQNHQHQHQHRHRHGHQQQPTAPTRTPAFQDRLKQQLVLQYCCSSWACSSNPAVTLVAFSNCVTFYLCP